VGYFPSKTPNRMQPDAHRQSSETGHRAAGNITLDRQIMRARDVFKAAVLTPLLSSALSGCAVRGAPSFVIAGSYFPGWMFCALIGIVLAIAVRIGFVTSGLAAVLPFQLFVCTAIGLCCGLIAWLLWFGQ
jgi:YtcA family